MEPVCRIAFFSNILKIILLFQELEMRIDTQKQTLSARDESIKKLLEMLQTKGEGKEEEARVHQQMQMVAQKQVRDHPREVFNRVWRVWNFSL